MGFLKQVGAGIATAKVLLSGGSLAGNTQVGRRVKRDLSTCVLSFLVIHSCFEQLVYV